MAHQRDRTRARLSAAQPEAEDQLKLGADREGYVEQTSGMITRRRWASLRGTSLFLFREKGVRGLKPGFRAGPRRPLTPSARRRVERGLAATGRTKKW